MNVRQLGWNQFGVRAFLCAAILAGSLSAWAGERPGAISGYVRDAAGKPQMGAIVKIAGPAHALTVFTDAMGFYSAVNLLPGFYSIQAWAPSFLPALTEKIGLQAGTSLHVNVTLTTLLNAMQVTPRHAAGDSDDWKWTLRSVANRPVLRVLNDPSGIEQQSPSLKANVSFLAGSAADGYGSGSDMSTAFSVERSIFAADHVGISGNVGYGDGLPTAVLRGSYSHRLMDGSGPSMSVTMRRFAPTDPNLHYAALQALALNAANDVAFGDVVELRFGSELQSIQFLGHVNAFRPYGSLDVHLSPNSVVEYAYTTSRPDMRTEEGFDSSPADLSEADPRVSMVNFTARLERARHQELSFAHRTGNTNMEVAVYSDHVANPALTGTGLVTAAGGFLLPDTYSGTFSYGADALDTNGFRVVLQRKLCSDLTATLDYAYGGALDLAKSDVELQAARQWLATEKQHALTAKLSGTIHGSHTRWIASYRFASADSLTPVDMFNSSPGQSDAFVSLFIRQPIPTLGFLPAHMEALVDIRNLLAQGYVPVIGQDGQTVYLVQSARAIRGGVAINF
ncbi:MAG TPA: carboxypeptidase-like regulatory domain-containing protein [Candidatus Binatia bacterium]|nr:carboxypeptidase-like regulatory domain-containing protein [Candidatus Binatia bacterium]